MPRRSIAKIVSDKEDQKKLAESDLEEFIKLVQPRRWLGSLHRDTITWWTSSKAKRHQLLLLPRDHMKSALIVLRAAWEITKDPTVRILFISANSNLAIKQLKSIKDILTSDVYRSYWPEMVNQGEAKRELWTSREISVDHPKRREFYVREPTVFTAGLTSNIVGLHCDIAILDDVVVAGNAYTEEGREKVRDQYSLLSSVETVNSREWVVGTRYHPNDLYSSLIDMEVDQFNDTGDKVHSEQLFEVKEHPVEVGGQFLWPREKQLDGKWYGFDDKVLADKRSQYLNKIHFRAQYYNDPHDVDSSPIKRNLFQYYDVNYISKRDFNWYFKRERLNLAAAVDFAYTTGKKSDSTSIVVVGADGLGNYYVLDIDRFKTDKISEYFSHILKLYEKWGFRKIRAEVTAGQSVIVKDLKDNYIRKHGLALTIDESRPTRWIGSKEERIMATLEPRYASGSIWHYTGGHCQTLEEELIFSNPAHDDVKDSLASAIDFITAPVNSYRHSAISQPAFMYHGRFGGVA
jgi:phage terminase large subunit-like protein